MKSSIRIITPTLFLLLLGIWAVTDARAQITNNLFSDDFSRNGIDTTKYAVDSPFFEGGQGDIAPTVQNGVLEFTGTVSQQWWAGATLRLLDTFEPSPETNIVVSVDRVAEWAEGTASRSALWIMDETRTKYILYADVRGEGGWHYNRYIGETGDVRTGGGTDIAAFNGVNPVTGAAYDDQGLHRMAVVLNGLDAKLYLDGIYGTAVKFPFSPVVIQLGSYARANGDLAWTVFDDLRVDAVGTATFSLNSLTMGTGQKATLTLRIPPGANASQAIPLQILNNRPAVAALTGAANGGTLTVNFEQGGPNTKTFELEGLALGSTRLTLTNTAGLPTGNALDVRVETGPTVLVEDSFTGNTLDTTKWRVNQQPFESGAGLFEVVQSGGTLQIAGSVTEIYWPGASIQTVGEFSASKSLPLVFEADRVSMQSGNPFLIDGTGARTGVFVTGYDASENNRTTPYVFFSQDLGTAETVTGWVANVSAAGAGTALPPLADAANDLGNHRMKMVADGEQVELFLDDVSAGRFNFPAAAFIKFELAAFAREYDDTVTGVFDNVRIERVLPCINMSPTAMLAIQGETGNTVTVTIPQLLNVSSPVNVTVTSQNPSVAEPEGAVNGALTLNFPTGTSSQTFRVVTRSAGNTVFQLTNDADACVSSSVSVSVTPPPVNLASDDFSGASLDTSKWTVSTDPLVEGGAMTAESAVVITNGTVLLDMTTELANWPGFTIWTTDSYTASAASPVVFEIDRVNMEYTLVGGDSSKQRTGIWVKSGTNFVFFSELGSYNATAPGWQYHRAIGQTGDVLLGNPDSSGTYIAPFNVARYTDQGDHRMRVVVNGATAKLYLDGVLGAEVAFPFAENLVFGFGAYANFSNNFGNPVWAYWDNAVVQGFPAQPDRPSLSVAQQKGNIVITWTGTGTLQVTESLASPISWAGVTPAPTGNSYTVSPTGQSSPRFYRVRQ